MLRNPMMNAMMGGDESEMPSAKGLEGLLAAKPPTKAPKIPEKPGKKPFKKGKPVKKAAKKGKSHKKGKKAAPKSKKK